MSDTLRHTRARGAITHGPKPARQAAATSLPLASLNAALLLLLAPAAALAQDSERTLSEVVVTASDGSAGLGLGTPATTGSNLGLTPMETPASVDVISREQLEQRGDHSLNDAITRAAGLSVMGHPGNGGSALSARGFTDGTSVMRLYDGLRQYGGIGVTFPFDTWSVERIEVLRGPASVIYGDGAIGGVINVIPKKPTRGPVENEMQATVGTQGTARLAFGSGGALDERWSYRLDLSGNRSDGWVDRGDNRDATFSGALQFDPSADLSLRLSHARGEQKPMRYFGTPLIDGRQLSAVRENNYNVADGEIRYQDSWTALDARWTPNAATTVQARLYHIDSERKWRNAETYVHDSGSGLIDRSGNTDIRHDQTQTGFTANAAFEGTLFGLKNTFSAGFDVNRARFRHSNNTYVGSSGPVDPYDPVPGAFQSSIPTIPRYRNTAAQHAVFVENRLALTAQWTVVAGLRNDHAEITRKDLVTGTRAFEQTYDDTGWRLGTVYQLTPDLSLYAQYAEAADPVGALLMLTTANSAFDLSRGRQTEIGLKQRFWQGKGEWTLAAYEIVKTDLLTRDAADPSLRVQVGQQSSRGIEAGISAAFAPGWRLEANAALLRARYDDFTESVGGVAVSRDGNTPTNVPERLANLWLSWNFQPQWTATAGLRYVDKRYADNANTLKLPAYTTTDLSLRWDLAPRTSLALNGYNVFDKKYFTTAYYTATQWFYGPSRRVELTLNHRF